MADPVGAKPPRAPLIVAALAALAVLVFAVWRRQGDIAPPPAPEGEASGPVIPAGWELQPLNGQSVLFSSFRGRPVFLNIWATWCGPCIVEMPSIKALAKRVESIDVAFVLVAEQPPEELQQFRERREIDLPLYHTERFPTALGITSLPTSMIVSPEGRVVYRLDGAADWDDDDVAKLLRRLVGSEQ